MSKYKKPIIFKQTKIVNKSLNKRGEIKTKGKTKDEKLMLIAQCTHHTITKKGTVKSRTIDNGDNTVTCMICGERFLAVPMEMKDLKKKVKEIIEMIQLGKWLHQGMGSGDEKSLDYLVRTMITLRRLPKIMGRILKMATKKKSVKKKEKRGSYNGSSGSMYGRWEG